MCVCAQIEMILLYTANGIVSRETVAKVVIGKNESTFKFERGVTALQLWPGTVAHMIEHTCND